MGSKNRHAKELLPIILKDRKEGQWYIEPFVGGANMIDKVDGLRWGNDFHPHLICLLEAVSKGWVPPKNISEEEYKKGKNDSKKEISPLIGFIGFLCSFGAKWFGGYARNKKGTNYALTGHNSLMKQAKDLLGVKFTNLSYDEMEIPDNSIIYCDPPYAKTTGYKTGDFDHSKFWQWCRNKVNEGHQVFVSEYNAPDDFICVWSKKVSSNFSSTRNHSSDRTEKLFIHKDQVNANKN